MTYPFEKAYELGHLITVFWAPLGVILASYTYIIGKMLQYSLRMGGSSDQEISGEATPLRRLTNTFLRPRSKTLMVADSDSVFSYVFAFCQCPNAFDRNQPNWWLFIFNLKDFHT